MVVIREAEAVRYMSSETHKDTFLTLIAVVRENKDERQKLLSILDLEPTRRKIAVNILVTNMRLMKVPDDFVEAWDSLQNDSVAENVRQIINDQTFEQRSRGWTAAIALGGIGFLYVLLRALVR